MALVAFKAAFTDLPDPEAAKAAMRANLARHVRFIDKAADAGAEFVGFPELSINGYRMGPNVQWLAADGPEVAELARKAAERGVYVGVGLAERDADGKRWNTQIVIGPDGKTVGRHRKIWLTSEKGHVGIGSSHDVFAVKGVPMGIAICADGSDFANLKALADKGAKIIYGPHANTTGGTTANWYRFRGKWGGAWDGKTAQAKTSNDGPAAEMPTGGWIAALKVHAALVNHAAVADPAFDAPAAPGTPTSKDVPAKWAAGAWFIGPDGATLAQQPASANRADSREHLLICDIPLPK
jgi:hypothetical protein